MIFPKTVHTGVISVWTVFFMFKMVKRLISLCLILGIVYCVSVVRDKKQLSDHVLRLHVVAASDSEMDQAVKLQVRDAVLGRVEQAMAQAEDKEEAKACVQEMLDQLEEVANSVLEEQGVEDRATVTLARETFPVREYDTFTLPSGVYDSLRVTIGEGQGKNWWCVVFPSLCIPAVSQDVEDVAAGAGFSDSLSGAITGQEQYELRFFLLDWLGKVENFFHQG